MHHIHHTEAIILGSRNFGESGKYFFLFTRHLGMVVASASGVRKMSSKLRYILQDFSYVKVDLVLGKDFWRITSASKTSELEEIRKNVPAFQVFYNISRMLRRLLTGAEQNEKLFDDLLSGLLVLEKSEEEEEIRSVEAVLVLRILHHLGYIGGGKAIEHFIHSPLEGEILYLASKERGRILDQINKALRETHL